jgi:hypothetical protein
MNRELGAITEKWDSGCAVKLNGHDRDKFFFYRELELVSEIPTSPQPKFSPGKRVGLITDYGKDLSPEILQTLKDGLERTCETSEPVSESPVPPTPIFESGDRVIHTKFGTHGEVIERSNTVSRRWRIREGSGHEENDYAFHEDELVFEGESIQTFTGYRTGDISDTHTDDQRANPKEPQYYGTVFPSGKTVIDWNTAVNSISIFNTYQEFEKIHGHFDDGYGTFIAWGEEL